MIRQNQFRQRRNRKSFGFAPYDEQGTTFVSIEKNVSDAAAYLRSKGVRTIAGLYGVSMGGASVIRFLATEDIPVEKAIIDAGITPYPYPKWVCRLIAMKDWVTVMLGTKSYALMKLAMPPKRWTPAGQDPERHYRRIFDFEKHHFSALHGLLGKTPHQSAFGCQLPPRGKPFSAKPSP